MLSTTTERAPGAKRARTPHESGLSRLRLPVTPPGHERREWVSPVRIELTRSEEHRFSACYVCHFRHDDIHESTGIHGEIRTLRSPVLRRLRLPFRHVDVVGCLGIEPRASQKAPTLQASLRSIAHPESGRALQSEEHEGRGLPARSRTSPIRVRSTVSWISAGQGDGVPSGTRTRVP